MTPLIKNLLGNGSRDRDTADELKALLERMQQERERCEKLFGKVNGAAERLQALEEPVANAETGIGSVTGRLAELEQRFQGMLQLAQQVGSLDERASEIAHGQQRAEQQVVDALERARVVQESLADFGGKLEQANVLKGSLEAFLETDKPFTQIRGEAEALRGQVDGTGTQLARLREQHDRLLDAHKLAMSKMEALDRRRDELGRSLTDKERRVGSVEQAVRGIDGVQHTVAELKREMSALKALGDTVVQKSAALESQREAVDRALGQAENLERAMRQLDTGMRQQQEAEKAFVAMNEEVVALRTLHEAVIERSEEIARLQRDTDEQARAARAELSDAKAEMKKTIDRFEFEGRGLESVTQRIADLRGTIADFENRFQGLAESSRTAVELKAQTQSLATHLQLLSDQAAEVDGEMVKLQAIRRDLDATVKTARDAGERVTRIEQSRPALDAALASLNGLGAAQAGVQDALEQTRVAHDAITRMRENQAEAAEWMAAVGREVGELRERVAEVRVMEPVLQELHGHARKLDESVTLIESRGEFVEDLHRRLAELGALSDRLDDRGAHLQLRLEAAEQRLDRVGEHAEQAAQLARRIAGVTASLEAAGRDADGIRDTVRTIGERCESVEALAEKTAALKPELEQRHNALAKAAKDLARATDLRQQAAASAQELGELSRTLASAVTTADKRAGEVNVLASELENRTLALRKVEERLGQFEKRMETWDLVEQELARSLEQIAARQGTVESVQADLDRMLVMAEKTAADVREIASAHEEIDERRATLREVVGQLRNVEQTAESLDERNRQVTRVEERLARAEALHADVRASLEALQGHKALVDQAVEKAGALQFMLKQAEAMIDGLREERSMSVRVRDAVGSERGGQDTEDDDAFMDEDDDQALAA
jgi:chromosome segregation ATPase